MKSTEKKTKIMRNKFTLIELLIVVAIIAILAGMLLPALNSAREMAKSISCMNKLKTLGTTVPLYTDSYNGFFPNSFAYVGSTLTEYYKILHASGILPAKRNDYWNDVSGALKDYYCPSAPAPTSVGNVYGMRYWQPSTYTYYNYPYLVFRPDAASTYSSNWLFFNSAQNKGFSKMPMFMDSAYMNGGKVEQCHVTCCYGSGQYGGGIWHNQKMNAAFADGHAESLSRKEMGKNDIRIRYAGNQSGMMATRTTD